MCSLFIGVQFAEAQVKEDVKKELKEKVEAVKTEILAVDDVKKLNAEAEELNSEGDKRVYSTKATEAKKVEKSTIIEKAKETPKTSSGALVPSKSLKEEDSDDFEEYYDLEKEEKENYDDDDDDIEDYR